MRRGTPILVIDDEPALLGIVRHLLRQAGFRVHAASSAREGLALARLDPPALILLDLSLPDLDGVGAARRLKEDPELADVPVVLLSGRGLEELDAKVAVTGAMDFLAKPFNGSDLVRRVRRWTEGSLGTLAVV